MFQYWPYFQVWPYTGYSLLLEKASGLCKCFRRGILICICIASFSLTKLVENIRYRFHHLICEKSVKVMQTLWSCRRLVILKGWPTWGRRDEENRDKRGTREVSHKFSKQPTITTNNKRCSPLTFSVAIYTANIKLSQNFFVQIKRWWIWLA